MIYFVLGFLAAIIIAFLFLRLRGNDKVINPEQVEKRQENLEKVMELANAKGEISNDDVQHALKVSDATAERYLSELEKQGKLVQSGSGKGVIYRPK